MKEAQKAGMRDFVHASAEEGCMKWKHVGCTPARAEGACTAIAEVQAKLEKKFAKELFWFTGKPDHLEGIQAETDRVLNA